jgi:hypothetical protein
MAEMPPNTVRSDPTLDTRSSLLELAYRCLGDGADELDPIGQLARVVYPHH